MAEKEKKDSGSKTLVDVPVQEFGPKYSCINTIDKERETVAVGEDHLPLTPTAPTPTAPTPREPSSIPAKPNGMSVMGPPPMTGASFMGQVSNDDTFDEDDYIRKTLRNFPWYWGLILSNSVANVLKWPNSFVVRRTIDASLNKIFLVTVRQNNALHHYEIRRQANNWTSPKLFGAVAPTTTNNNNNSFTHIHQMIDSWSLKSAGGMTPIPRPTTSVFHDNIKMTKVLGKGAFGDVWAAKITLPNGETKDCAVKMIRGDATRSQLSEFYQEVGIMSLFDNPYVIRYYGTACLLTPVMVAMELLSGGNMRSYLRSNPNVSFMKMCEMASDIARGMKHLARCTIIHRDLAARNCLLTDDQRVKISDFGLSVQAIQVCVKKLKQAPIRWLSPETLSKGLFNEKTDVWSYGVVLWEIFTKCANPPLHPKTLKESMVVIKEVDNPHKLLQGDAEISDMIAVCCKKNPTERLTFEGIVQFWDNFIVKRKELKVKPAQKKGGTLRKRLFGKEKEETSNNDDIFLDQKTPTMKEEQLGQPPRPKGGRSINKRFTTKAPSTGKPREGSIYKNL